jgi:hypothetical protein
MSNNLPSPDRAGAPGGEWLFLIHQLPAGTSNGRVKTWRRLQALGAIWLRNAAYVLPNSAQAREDFMWLRGEIASLGGAATVLVGDAIDGADRLSIVEAFTAARAADYGSLLRQIDRAARQLGRLASGSPRGRFERRVTALASRLRAVEAIDYCSAPGSDDARRALHSLEERMGRARRARTVDRTQALNVKSYRDRVWVTRRRPGVDRMSCAWLIRRFIDPSASFVFADADAAAPEGQVAFDRFEGEFTHVGQLCTFEVLKTRFGLEGRPLERISAIVHDIDLKDDRHQLPETMTVGTLIDGIRKAHTDDGEALRAGMEMFEGLYRAFEAQEYSAGRRPRRKRKPRRK